MINHANREQAVLPVQQPRQRRIECAEPMGESELRGLESVGWLLETVEHHTSKRGHTYRVYVFRRGEPTIERR